MKTKIQTLFITLAIFAGVYQTNAATVFPIATNPAIVELSVGTAFDGTNYFVIMVVGTNLAGQLFSASGALIGSQTNIGGNPGFLPEAALAFGKTNYLVAWSDNSISSGVDMFGQFISRSGTKVGPAFNLLSSQGSHGFQTVSALAFDGTNFLAVWQDNDDGNFYGQLVTQSGTLSGSEFQISGQQDDGSSPGQSAAVTFGKTNYLVAWQDNFSGDDYKTEGEFVSRSGSTGSPFQIDQTDSPDENPLAIAFDGTNYFVVWNWDPAQATGDDKNWNLHGRLISQTGAFPGNELDLVADPGNQVIPSLAFDGSNYLLTWSENNFSDGIYTTNSNINFQFFNRSGSAIGGEFTVFTAQGTNAPILADNGLIFDGSRYVIAGSLGTVASSGGRVTGFPSSEVFGAFIPASAVSPQLNIAFSGANVVLMWPTNASGFTLQSTTNLASSTDWVPVTSEPVIVGDQNTVSDSISGGTKFYQLIFKP